MNSTGRKSEKSGYLVILLLVVGLTAFSQSMKELTEIHQLTVDAGRLVAQLSGDVTPAEIPQIAQVSQIPQTVVRIEKLEGCQSRQPAQAVEPKIQRNERRVITVPSETQIAKLKELQRIGIDPDAYEVRVPAVQIPDSDEQVTTEFPAFTFKTKTRKPGAFRISPRDREILLKTLSRSINLRIAS